MTLSDTVAIMQKGEVDAIGTPHALFSRPPTRFVAGFFGGHNLIPATLQATSSNGHASIEVLGQQVTAPTAARLEEGDKVRVAAPAPAIRLAPGTRPRINIPATVIEALYIGDAVQVSCNVDGAGVLHANVAVEEGLALAAGSDVQLYIDTADTVVVGERTAAPEANPSPSNQGEASK